MGVIISYDDKFGMPSSEIELASGEHVLLTLDKNGLVVKALARSGSSESTLFTASAKITAGICAGLLNDRHGTSKVTPLQILAAAVSQMPNAAAVRNAFNSAAAAV